jgi:excisionase family DNA binding protein
MFRQFPDLLSVKEVQQALRVGRSTAYKLLTSGELKSFRIGATYRIPKAYLMDYIRKTQ